MTFNGIYTIQNLSTGEHRTFAVRTQPKDSRFAPGSRVVSLMIGPDNENSYQGWGFLNLDGIRIWKSKRSPTFTHYANMMALAIASLSGDEEILTGSFEYLGRTYEVNLAKRCRVCNRQLTTPESIKAGIGPVCAGRTESEDKDWA